MSSTSVYHHAIPPSCPVHCENIPRNKIVLRSLFPDLNYSILANVSALKITLCLFINEKYQFAAKWNWFYSKDAQKLNVMPKIKTSFCQVKTFPSCTYKWHNGGLWCADDVCGKIAPLSVFLLGGCGGLQQIEMRSAKGLLFSGWVQSLMVYQESTSGHISTRLEVETEHPQSVNLILCVHSHIFPSYSCVGYEMQLWTLWNHGVFYEMAWSYRSLSFLVYLSLSPSHSRYTTVFALEISHIFFI